jgi:phage shock protein PspC (stress-responsive transcriptional regulator)
LQEIKKYFIELPMKKFREIIELQAFGVCAAIGEKMGIATSRIRMWFIYISFLTFGSPVIIYMILAFWINIKNYIYSAKRNPLRYL